MVATTSADVQEREREIVITRVFDAPRHLVFQAWTEPDRVARWLGPPDFVIAYCTMDVRPGGAFRLCLRSPSGVEYWRQGVYKKGRLHGFPGRINKLIFQHREDFHGSSGIGVLPGKTRFGFLVAG